MSRGDNGDTQWKILKQHEILYLRFGRHPEIKIPPFCTKPIDVDVLLSDFSPLHPHSGTSDSNCLTPRVCFTHLHQRWESFSKICFVRNIQVQETPEKIYSLVNVFASTSILGFFYANTCPEYIWFFLSFISSFRMPTWLLYNCTIYTCIMYSKRCTIVYCIGTKLLYLYSISVYVHVGIV